MLRSEGYALPLGRSLEAFLAGLALLPTPAKAGVAVRSVLLLEAGVPVHVSLAAYFVERLLDFVGLVMLASLLVGAHVAGNRWLLGLAIGIAALLAIVVAQPVGRAIRPRLASFPRLVRALDWLLTFLEDATHMLGGWRLPLFLLLGLAANAATGVLLWIALGAASGPVDLAYALGVLGLAHLSGSITLLPGGIGGFELAMMGALDAAGVALPLVVAAVAAVRVITLWGSVAVGLPLLWLAMRRARAIP
jgi:glycosyltransferase 2 family protein